MALDPEQVAHTYDRIGRLQDWQAFYEDPATERLITNAGFDDARRVFELGCGTGRFAALLLDRHLPPDGRYVGVDISPRMVQLASARLRPWSDRAEVHLGDSADHLLPDGSADRFVANYVVDLLSEEDAREAIAETRRLLAPGGTLCLVSLTQRTGQLHRAGVGRVRSACGAAGRASSVAVGQIRLWRTYPDDERIEHRSIVGASESQLGGRSSPPGRRRIRPTVLKPVSHGSPAPKRAPITSSRLARSSGPEASGRIPEASALGQSRRDLQGRSRIGQEPPNSWDHGSDEPAADWTGRCAASRGVGSAAGRALAL